MNSDIESRDRLIVALDFEDIQQAKSLVVELGESVTFYKIGLQLCMTGEYFGLLDWLVAKQKKVFVSCCRGMRTKIRRAKLHEVGR